MTTLVLDTHVVVWWLEANPKLPRKVRAMLENAETDLHLPALVVAELVDICVKGRSGLELQAVVAVLRDDERFVLHNLTGEMALDTSKYVLLQDIHDRCIVATAANLIQSIPGAVLITRDRAIRDSGLVPTVWE